MNEERKRILDMLANGKINAEEAEKLISAIEQGEKKSTDSPRKLPKYLFVKVNEEDGDNVNIRIPMKLISAGIKLTSLIPQSAQSKINEKLEEKGVDFDIKNISQESLFELVDALTEFEVNVEGKETVKIYCGDA
jgi:hypothetical protein